MLHAYTDLEVRARDFGKKFREDKGAAMVEYGLLVALIAIVVIAALLILGPAIKGIFTSAGDELNKSR